MARYSSALNRMVEGDELTPVTSAARTATGNSGWLSSEEFENALLELDVTAASGTSPTLNVSVETAETNAGGSSQTLGTFAQKTAVSNERKSFNGFDRFYRIVWTIAGTSPSFTFSVLGESK